MNSKQVKEFLTALNHIVEEKGVDKSIVVEAMEQGLAAAYKKNEGYLKLFKKISRGSLKNSLNF